MLIFKTSGETLPGVIKCHKHAYNNHPTNWSVHEPILIAKRKKDLEVGEKQIQYVARLSEIKQVTNQKELEKCWSNVRNWRYIYILEDIIMLKNPFNLEDLGIDKTAYRPIVTFKKLPPNDESKVLKYLREKEGITF